MTNNTNILTAQNIFKSYKMGLNKVQVLKGIDLSVKKGEFLAIIGASGSGKSTLLHILGALDKPDSGSILFEDQDISKYSSTRLNKFRNKKVGFVFQFYHLLDELNITENVYLPSMASKSVLAWFAARNEVKKSAQNLLSRFGLAHRLKHKPFQLSGGERQRAAIARALMNKPQILLADEPTGNLDSETGNGILKVFDELNSQGQTIIMVTHDPKIAQRAHRVITLTDGKIT